MSEPHVTYYVKVANNGGYYGGQNEFFFSGSGIVGWAQDVAESFDYHNDCGVNPTGMKIYKFDLSDSTNSTHPFNFSETPNGTWDGGTALGTGEGVYHYGVRGQPGASVKFHVPEYRAQESINTTIFPYCASHSNMGGDSVFSINEISGDECISGNYGVSETSSSAGTSSSTGPSSSSATSSSAGTSSSTGPSSSSATSSSAGTSSSTAPSSSSATSSSAGTSSSTAPSSSSATTSSTSSSNTTSSSLTSSSSSPCSLISVFTGQLNTLISATNETQSGIYGNFTTQSYSVTTGVETGQFELDVVIATGASLSDALTNLTPLISHFYASGVLINELASRQETYNINYNTPSNSAVFSGYNGVLYYQGVTGYVNKRYYVGYNPQISGNYTGANVSVTCPTTSMQVNFNRNRLIYDTTGVLALPENTITRFEDTVNSICTGFETTLTTSCLKFHNGEQKFGKVVFYENLKNSWTGDLTAGTYNLRYVSGSFTTSLGLHTLGSGTIKVDRYV